MKFVAKTVILALAATAMTSPALAATSISSPSVSTALTGTGNLDADSPNGNHVCAVVLTGSVTSSTQVVFDSGTTTGTLCDDAQGVFDDFVVNTVPTSTSQLKVVTIDFNAPFGLCKKNNVTVNWNNGTSTATISPQNIGLLCDINSFSAVISPAVVLIP